MSNEHDMGGPALPAGWAISAMDDQEVTVHVPGWGPVIAQKYGSTVASRVLYDLVEDMLAERAKRTGGGK